MFNYIYQIHNIFDTTPILGIIRELIINVEKDIKFPYFSILIPISGTIIERIYNK